jgi:NAD(P)-dependent dehydrogenase (short-subunit alcohol dehydrogenase family)
MSDKWTVEQIPDQSGRIALVTGANSGLGLITARELARVGARVVLACRKMEKGAAALGEITTEIPEAAAELVALDLASLDSIRSFAQEFTKTHDGLDLLINNAGVMAPPRRTTRDGFELQFGTNHLGHFALTGLLLGALEGRKRARVVTVSSTAHRMGRIDFDDLQGERRYRRWRAYGQSKLANLLFALELDRRLRAAGSAISSLAAHPGYAATNLQSASAPMLDRAVMAVTNRLIAQDAEIGALSLLYAATQPALEGGTYVGPDGRGEHRGHPQPEAAPTSAALDQAVAARLWIVSEQATGVHFDLPAASGQVRESAAEEP